uniref:Uncharacterized protein n=1 Tax=Anguilla anguilla TaxID=7936 RepID=A0A0E9SPX0_ANGAN
MDKLLDGFTVGSFNIRAYEHFTAKCRTGNPLPPFCLHHRAFEKTLSKVEIEQESLKALSF